EKAANGYIRIRKGAIEEVAEMLQDAQYCEALLALLEYMADKDLILSIRERAKEILDIQFKEETSLPNLEESRHTFGIKCPKGHIIYFDKRQICPSIGTDIRRVVQ